jgi:hypothetical protein
MNLGTRKVIVSADRSPGATCSLDGSTLIWTGWATVGCPLDCPAAGWGVKRAPAVKRNSVTAVKKRRPAALEAAEEQARKNGP